MADENVCPWACRPDAEQTSGEGRGGAERGIDQSHADDEQQRERETSAARLPFTKPYCRCLPADESELDWNHRVDTGRETDELPGDEGRRVRQQRSGGEMLLEIGGEIFHCRMCLAFNRFVESFDISFTVGAVVGFEDNFVLRVENDNS